MLHRLLSALLVAILAVPAAWAEPSSALQDTTGPVMADGVIVSFGEARGQALAAQARQVASRGNLQVEDCYDDGGYCVLQGDVAGEHRVRAEAARGALAGVERVEPNYVLRLAADPFFGQQWQLGNTGQDYVLGDLNGDGRSETTLGIVQNRAGADIGWAEATAAYPVRGAGVTVAVIDSGVAFGGELPESARAPGGWNFIEDNDQVDDTHGHGTFIAGLIAAREDGAGITGVAPQALILPLRIADSSGTATVAQSAAAIRYAAEQGADVINFSLASTDASVELAAAILDATNAGAIFVAAAGNNNGSITTYPAAFPGVVGVGAVSSDGRLAPFSNTNPDIDVVAPGVHLLSLLAPRATADCKTRGVYSTAGPTLGYSTRTSCHLGSDLQPLANGATYDIASGTSFAAPLVAGAAALLREQQGRTLTSAAFEELLRTRSTHPTLPAGQRDDSFGYGMLRIPSLLAASLPGGGEPPSSTPIPSSTEPPVSSLPSAPESSPPQEGPISGFADVPDDHFASAPVLDLRMRGILQGRPDGLFQPDATMTRAEFAKVIAGVRGKTVGGAQTFFTDVPETHSLASFVQRVVELGWARGQGVFFHPDLPISRMEAARMITRAAELQPTAESPFIDLRDREETAVAGAVANAQIFSGQDGRFMPDRAITRAEAAKVLAKILI